MIENYLGNSRQLRGIVQLLDARREPSSDDVGMLDFLAELEIPTLVAVTKIDKIGASQVATRVSELSRALGLDPEQMILFSAVTGQGRDELAEAVVTLVEQPSRAAEG